LFRHGFTELVLQHAFREPVRAWARARGTALFRQPRQYFRIVVKGQHAARVVFREYHATSFDAQDCGLVLDAITDGHDEARALFGVFDGGSRHHHVLGGGGSQQAER